MPAEPPRQHAVVRLFAPCHPQTMLWRFAAVLAALTVVRVLANTFIPLSGEEAYYWLWSRHLDLSYWDHPPLIGWVIRLGTLCAGHTPFGVRLAALALHTGTTVLVWDTARRMFRDTDAAAWAGLLCTTTVFFGITATLIIPDAALFFFWALAVRIIVEIAQSGRVRLWPAAGAALGFCALAKYHAILLAAALGLFLLFCPRQRRHLRCVWLYFGAVIAIGMTVPIFWWNMRHGWPSFEYQLAGRHAAVFGSPLYVAEMLAMPFAMVGVVTYPLCIAAAIRALRAGDDARRFLALACLGPIVFFLILSFFIRIDPDWAVPGYVTGVILAADMGLDLRRRTNTPGWRRRLLPAAAVSGAAMLLLGYVAVLLVFAVPNLFPTDAAPVSHRPRIRTEKLDRFYGWPEIGRRIGRDAVSLGDDRPVFLFCISGYATAASLRFYTPGHPPVRLLTRDPARAHHFSILQARTDAAGWNAVIVDFKNDPVRRRRARQMFDRVEEAKPIEIRRGGRLRRRLPVDHAWGFRDAPQADDDGPKTSSPRGPTTAGPHIPSGRLLSLARQPAERPGTATRLPERAPHIPILPAVPWAP